MKAAVWSFVAGALLASSASGIVVYWGNPGTGNWNVATNWIGGVVPGNDDARIGNGGTAVIDDTQTVNTGFATLGDTNGAVGYLLMTGGRLNTTSSDIRIGGNASTGGGIGSFTQTGGVVTMNFGNLNVGFGTTARGTYNLSGGSLSLNTGAGIFAVGNRGVGIINQSGGTIYVKAANGFTQLGRNVAAGTGFGTYTLSGGTLATPRLIYGNAVGTADVSTNIFTLTGSAVLRVGTIYAINTTADNEFIFTGGTLAVTNIGIPLRNSGGILNPTFFDFGNAAAVSIDTLPSNQTATLTFTNLAASYVQDATGTLVIDIADSTSYDRLDLGAGAANGAATLGGTIAVHLLNNYDPPLETSFDVVIADSITNHAVVTGATASGYTFAPTLEPAGDGRTILRLTVVDTPAPPQLIDPVKLADGSFRFSFRSTQGASFTVLATTNIVLPTSSWTVLGPVFETSPGLYQFTETIPPGTGQRFYRVRSP